MRSRLVYSLCKSPSEILFGLKTLKDFQPLPGVWHRDVAGQIHVRNGFKVYGAW